MSKTGQIRCMVVEDEPSSQELLRQYINDVPSLTLVSVCHNAVEAGRELLKQPIDLMFLDIQMPILSGTQFYASLTQPPPVIFTTAYPEYAVNGFELNAIDYLVKPFSFERFQKAISKFQISTPKNTFLLLYADKKAFKVNLDDIEYIEAMGDYVRVKTADQRLVVHQTLQKMSEQLSPQDFRRIHKSYIISIHKLQYIEGNTVRIAGAEIPIGQTYRADFLQSLNLNS